MMTGRATFGAMPQIKRGFPDGSVVKNPPANSGDVGSIPESGRSPEGGNGTLLPVLLPGESHGQRSLESYTVHGVVKSSTLLSTHPDCSLPSSSVHGISQARILEWGCHFLLQGIFLTQGSNLRIPTLAGTFFTTRATWEARWLKIVLIN